MAQIAIAIYVDHSIMGILWFLWRSPGHVFRALARVSSVKVIGHGNRMKYPIDGPNGWPRIVRLASLSSFASSSIPEWATRGIEEGWIFLRGLGDGKTLLRRPHTSNNNASGQLATADL